MIVAGLMIGALVVGIVLGTALADLTGRDSLRDGGPTHPINTALTHLRNAERHATAGWCRDARLEIQRASK